MERRCRPCFWKIITGYLRNQWTKHSNVCVSNVMHCRCWVHRETWIISENCPNFMTKMGSIGCTWRLILYLYIFWGGVGAVIQSKTYQFDSSVNCIMIIVANFLGFDIFPFLSISFLEVVGVGVWGWCDPYCKRPWKSIRHLYIFVRFFTDKSSFGCLFGKFYLQKGHTIYRWNSNAKWILWFFKENDSVIFITYR